MNYFSPVRTKALCMPAVLAGVTLPFTAHVAGNRVLLPHLFALIAKYG